MRYNPEVLILPYEALSDDRLTLRQVRVLMAIASWRKSNTNVAHVSREMLSERTGYPISRVSEITSQLVEMGWIEKKGDGGRGKWSAYSFSDGGVFDKTAKKPKQKAESKQQENGYQSGNGYQNRNGYQNGNETVTKSVTLNTTERNTERSKKKKSSRSLQKDLSGKPANVDEQVWTDFIRQRKTALTPTALNRIKKEAEKAGWALTDALEESVTRGWQSFKADWVSKQPIPSQTQDIQSNGLPNGLPKGMRWVGGAR